MPWMPGTATSFRAGSQAEAKHSYGGSMKFERRGDAEYLIRRPYSSSTRQLFGRRSPETKSKLSAFLARKSKVG